MNRRAILKIKAGNGYSHIPTNVSASTLRAQVDQAGRAGFTHVLVRCRKRNGHTGIQPIALSDIKSITEI